MNLDALQSVEIIEALENFLEIIRPPEPIRHKLDISYRIEGQNIYIFEISPFGESPSEITHLDMAKTTFVKSKNEWKIFWRRGSGTWDSYGPKPTVKSINDFLNLVIEDKHSCFWG